MGRTTLNRFMIPLIGLVAAVGSLAIAGSVARQPVNFSPTVSVDDVCVYNTKGFPTAVTEIPVTIDGFNCPTATPLEPVNMIANWLFYSAVVALVAIMIWPPVWMRRNETVRVAGYSASLCGLVIAALFGWGMSVTLLGL